MKTIFPPVFRFIWGGLILVNVIILRATDWIEIALKMDGGAAIEFSMGLNCLFLCLVILSREKVEDERLIVVRGKAFLRVILTGLILSLWFSFSPVKDNIFASGLGMMVYMQILYLLNFHFSKNKAY